MYGRKVKWQVDKFMAFCNAKKVFWELHVHLNILSFSIVTNKRSEVFCKPIFENLQEISIYNVSSISQMQILVIVNDTNVIWFPLSFLNKVATDKILSW